MNAPLQRSQDMNTLRRALLLGSILAALSAAAVGCGSDGGDPGDGLTSEPVALGADGVLVARRVDEPALPEASDPGASSATMNRFASCAQLKRVQRAQGFRKDSLGFLSLQSGDSGFLSARTSGVAEAGDFSGSVEATGSNEAGTNVQEAGIDESDWVKVVGSDILISARGKLRAIGTGGGAPVIRGELELPKNVRRHQPGHRTDLSPARGRRQRGRDPHRIPDGG